MANTNVIEFAPALQRRRKRQNAHTAHAGYRGSWHDRCRDGIDGLWVDQRLRTSGEVVQLVTVRRRLAAFLPGETRNG